MSEKKCPFLEKSNFFSAKMKKITFFVIDKIYITTNTQPLNHKQMEYYFKMLTNIKVAAAYLHKRNNVVMGLYRQGNLVGGLLPVGSPIALQDFLSAISSIFPPLKKDIPLYQSLNLTITYANNGWGKFLKQTYIPISDNNYIASALVCIEPIIVYLPKVEAYVAALYWHQYLVGICHFSDLSISKLEKLPIRKLFPTDLNHLDSYLTDNLTVDYFIADEQFIIQNS